MLPASAVDAMLKAKGYTSVQLDARINKARDAHLITSEMASWAHHVRLEANDQRHPDVTAAMPTEAEAEQTIEFVRALAQFVFVLPARVTRGIAAAASGTMP